MEKSMERKALEQKLTGFFEELHMHPELSYEEYETTEADQTGTCGGRH